MLLDTKLKCGLASDSLKFQVEVYSTVNGHDRKNISLEYYCFYPGEESGVNADGSYHWIEKDDRAFSLVLIYQKSCEIE